MANLRTLLDDAGITQRQLAVALDTSESTVSRIVAGRQSATAEQVSAIAKVIGEDPATVLSAVLGS